jgi:hypothetical protein
MLGFAAFLIGMINVANSTNIKYHFCMRAGRKCSFDRRVVSLWLACNTRASLSFRHLAPVALNGGS